MVAWIEVVDTAVKVGLGALIAGVASYVISNRIHKNELGKLRTTKRYELLEVIAEKIEAFSIPFRKYSTVARNIVDYTNKQKHISDSKYQRHIKHHGELHLCVDELSAAQSLLYLLGEDDVQDKLEKYIINTEYFVHRTEYLSQDTDGNEESILDDEIIKLIDETIEDKKQVFQALHRAYKNIGAE